MSSRSELKQANKKARKDSCRAFYLKLALSLDYFIISALILSSASGGGCRSFWPSSGKRDVAKI